MYKIILADDEPWVAYRLLHLANWEQYGFEVIETVTDGPAAYQACIDKKPDVLLTDIRMPGMDGLELVEALRRDIAGIEVVLISGYAEFSYAQKAIKLGAFDYLVKQVSREQIEDLLVRLARKLSDKPRHLDVYFSLLDSGDNMSVGQWLALRQPEQNHTRFRFCTFAIEQGQYPELLYEHLTPEYSEIIIRTGKNKASVLLSGINSDMDGWKKPGGYCGYSEVGGAEVLFGSLYRHSDMAFRTACFLNSEAPIEYVKRYDEVYMTRLLNDMEKALSSKDYHQCGKLLSAAHRTMDNMMLNQIEVILSRIYNAFCLNQLLPPIENEIREERYFSTAYGSLSEVFELFGESMTQTEQSGEFPLALIVKYIDENFAQEIHVSDLAKRFHFSSGYFSTMFSKGMDQPFTKYITDKRLAHAKKLLRETGLNIQEVADRSGYGDYFQFTKAFKRLTGTTPGQYRKSEA